MVSGNENTTAIENANAKTNEIESRPNDNYVPRFFDFHFDWTRRKTRIHDWKSFYSGYGWDNYESFRC